LTIPRWKASISPQKFFQRFHRLFPALFLLLAALALVGGEIDPPANGNGNAAQKSLLQQKWFW